MLDLIKKLLIEGDYNKAYDLLTEGNNIDKADQKYIWCLTQCYKDKAYFENNPQWLDLAIKVITDYLDDNIDESNETIWNQLLSCHLRKEDYEEFFIDCKFILKHLPQSDYANNIMGAGLSNCGKYSEALIYADRAIMIEPQNYVYRLNRYNILLSLNRKEEALKEYNTAILLLEGKTFQYTEHQFVFSLGVNYEHPFLFNSLCQLNSLEYNTINENILNNYTLYKPYEKYFYYITRTTEIGIKIKILSHYLGNDLSLVYTWLNVKKIVTNKEDIIMHYIYFESFWRVWGFATVEHVQYLEEKYNYWYRNIDNLLIEELFLLTRMGNTNLVIEKDSPYFLKLMSTDNFISRIYKEQNIHTRNNLIQAEKEKIGFSEFGSAASEDYHKLVSFIVLKAINEDLNPDESYAVPDFSFMDHFIISQNTDEFITVKIREFEIESLVNSFLSEFNPKLVYNNSNSLEYEIQELKDVFLQKKEILKSIYLSLSKFDSVAEEMTLEKAIAMKIEKFDCNHPKPYYLLIKLFYLQNKINLYELLYLHFFITYICKLKGKGIRVSNDSIIKGKEEFLKSTIKIFGTMIMASVGFVSKFGEIAVSTLAGVFGKLYESFLKQLSEEDLLPEINKYDEFKLNFMVHISFLHESYGEKKFREIYLIDYSSLGINSIKAS